ncbi:NAD-dependent epimerase [Agromyces protaetiae]|uniref:NAD-dependent epimerase n=1 Tax=Agromyces protaetiae TaxID=2509455 RepID=A0A4P6FFA9_9MICO|nr:NAD(P)H-binding protein [Agromyces protaetiae]QAY73753.1 NAD-dependent epimerase [Agromyces protaetiae]
MSNITVIGGTGYAGAAIVAEAVKRGHAVTAVSRTAPEQPVDGVAYVQADAAGAERFVAGADVVIGALSPRAGTEGTLRETYTKLARAAADEGARLFIVGGFSSTRPAEGAPRFVEGEIPEAFAAEAREGDSIRELLETSAPDGLDWVFLSPAGSFGAFYPHGEARGTYRTSTGIALFDEQGESKLEAADFALAVLDEIERPAHHRTLLHIAY